MFGKKRKYRSKKLALKKRKKMIWRLSILGFLILVFFVGGFFLTKHHSMQISLIKIEDNEYVPSKEILKIVEEEISGKYLFIFSKRNSVIYPRLGVEKALIKEFSSIRDVNFDLLDFKTIEVRVVEYESTALWCHFVGEENLIEECFYLNDSGYVFVKEPLINTNQFVKFYSGLNEGEAIERQTYFTEEIFEKLVDFTKLLRRIDIKIAKVEPLEGGSFKVITNAGAELRINIEDDINLIFSNLETVIKRDAISKAQLDNLEYVDLRFGNRVFYKIK